MTSSLKKDTNSASSSFSASSPTASSNSFFKSFLTQKNLLKKLSTNSLNSLLNTKNKEEAIEVFCQQQINHINQLNDRLREINQSTENNENNNRNDQNISSTNGNIEFKKGTENIFNSFTLNRTLLTSLNNNLIVKDNEMNYNNAIPHSNTLSKSILKDDIKNISVLETIDDDHSNNYSNYDIYENKLIIDVPIEINPVIEKIRSLRQKKEIQQIISKISNFCDDKLKKVIIIYIIYIIYFY